MSWQAYVDTNLVGSGKVTKAAILGQKGGVWATSPGFTLSAEEQKAITDAFGAGGVASLQSSGLRLQGQKYILLRADDNSVYGKTPTGGCALVKTKQAILVGVYEAPLQAGESTPVVESLGDYLKSVNY